MAIQDDFSIAANGDIRHDSGTATYTVLQLHRWLQDYADQAQAAGNDRMDITISTPSERATDNIIKLLSPFNIDDTAAQFLYDGSISQLGASNDDVIYSGLVVVGALQSGELTIVQNNAVLTNTWQTHLNADAAQNILMRALVKSRTGAADIDGKRIRVQARTLSDTYAEFLVTLATGNSTAAIFTAEDLNNQTAEGTISGWTTATNQVEGYIGIDITGDAVNEFYYSRWTKGSQTLAQLYERTKWLQRDGSASTIYGMNGELFRGITHQVAVSAGTGTWVQNENVTWGSGATAGAGKLLAADSMTGSATTKLWLQLVTGAAPASGTATGNGGATGTIGTVTPRTISPAFIGASTGTALIGAYGIGVLASDLVTGNQFFDLDNTLRVPPNNVTFTVLGATTSEDRILVGPALAGVLDVAQRTLSVSLSGASETAIVVTVAIPADTPTSGTVRVQLNSGIYKLVPYSSWSGSTFNITAGPEDDFTADPATAPKNVFISYIDKLATATNSFTGVYAADRDLFIRVRDGGGTPIKTFETTGTLSTGGGSATVIRTPDA